MSKASKDKDVMELSTDELVRNAFTDIAYTIFSMCKDIGIFDVKLIASYEPDTGTCRFKAKLEGNEVLSIKAANDHFLDTI